MALQKLVTIVFPRTRRGRCGVAERRPRGGRLQPQPLSLTARSTRLDARAAPCTTCGSALADRHDRRARRRASGHAGTAAVRTVRSDPMSPRRPSIRGARGTDRVAAPPSNRRPRRRSADRQIDVKTFTDHRSTSPPTPLPTRPKVRTAPTLQGPTPPRPASPAAWNTNSRTRARRSDLEAGSPHAWATITPFVDESSANELFYPNKADRPWRYIVLHHSASASGSYDQIDREHRKILGYRRLRLPFRDRQRHGQRRRPDRDRPAVEQPETRRSLPQRPHSRRGRVRYRHLPGRRPRPATPDATPNRRGQSPGRLSQPAIPHRSRVM